MQLKSCLPELNANCPCSLKASAVTLGCRNSEAMQTPRQLLCHVAGYALTAGCSGFSIPTSLQASRTDCPARGIGNVTCSQSQLAVSTCPATGCDLYCAMLGPLTSTSSSSSGSHKTLDTQDIVVITICELQLITA